MHQRWLATGCRHDGTAEPGVDWRRRTTAAAACYNSDAMFFSRPLHRRLGSRPATALPALLVLFLSAGASGQAPPPPSAKPALPAVRSPQSPEPQGLMPDATQISERVATARDLFSRGQYAAAAELLQQVIALDPKPIHVFNLGQSQRRAAQIEEARSSYQRFIELAPQHPSVGEARNYIRELDSISAQVRLAEQAYRKQLVRTRSELLQQLNQTRDELLSERAQVAALRRDTPMYKRPWFWGVLGGALTAAVVTAVVVGYVATRAPEPPPTDTGYIGFTF